MKTDTSKTAAKNNKPAYPLLISIDKEGFETSVKNFLRVVCDTITGVKEAYNEMELDEPFDDATWELICQNSQIVAERYAKKVKVVADIIGVSSGLTKGVVLNNKHPNINKINLIVSNLTQSLYFTQANSNAQLRPNQVINVNTEPELTPDAYQSHLQAYRHYINNAYEANKKAMFDRFVNEYNTLIDGLINSGYEQHIGNINNTFLNEFFDSAEGHRLKTNLSAPAFLAKNFIPKF
jgi:hypothetical protein